MHLKSNMPWHSQSGACFCSTSKWWSSGSRVSRDAHQSYRMPSASPDSLLLALVTPEMLSCPCEFWCPSKDESCWAHWRHSVMRNRAVVQTSISVCPFVVATNQAGVSLNSRLGKTSVPRRHAAIVIIAARFVGGRWGPRSWPHHSIVCWRRIGRSVGCHGAALVHRSSRCHRRRGPAARSSVLTLRVIPSIGKHARGRYRVGGTSSAARRAWCWCRCRPFGCSSPSISIFFGFKPCFFVFESLSLWVELGT